jgi:hypothetical protein
VQSDLSEPVEVTLQVADTFERLGIPYLVGGSLASSLHGIPRATQDVDMVAGIGLRHVDGFVAALEGTFYVDADMIRDAIRRGTSFNIIHLATMFKVDVFVLGRDELSREEMSRRQIHRVGDPPERELFVASPEDVIVQKLDWYRKGGEISERQWNDLLGVLKVQGERIDVAYLRRWSTAGGTLDLLERALAQAGLPG